MTLPALQQKCLLHVSSFWLSSARAGTKTFLHTSIYMSNSYLVLSKCFWVSRWMDGWISYYPVFLFSDHFLSSESEPSVAVPLCCHLLKAHTSEAGMEIISGAVQMVVREHWEWMWYVMVTTTSRRDPAPTKHLLFSQPLTSTKARATPSADGTVSQTASSLLPIQVVI